MYLKKISLALCLVQCFNIICCNQNQEDAKISKMSLLQKLTLDLSVKSIQCVIYFTNYQSSKNIVSGLSIPLIFNDYKKTGQIFWNLPEKYNFKPPRGTSLQAKTILECSHVVVDIDTIEETFLFLDKFKTILPVSGYYYFFLDQKNTSSPDQSRTLFDHKFFQKVQCFSRHQYLSVTSLQVLNAVLFQSTSSKTVYVDVKEITSEVRKVPYDLWNGTRFLLGKDLFPDKLRDFGGLVLKSTSFNFQPYTYQNEDGSWGGWEYQIMRALASNLNFDMDIQPPPNGELWGENMNGSFTGNIQLQYNQ